ncbi:MAG: hypothetical protein JSU74_13165 [Candidatus Zixiibacteriota bacterium]|nr:MAG: hypothetical protein JSU74_13165 [candidate division Zixibacteria bacterium]
MIRAIVAMLAPLLISTGALSQPAERAEPGLTISFDDSAARYVLENPANALADERETIWNTFEGYRITLVWHEKSSFPITWDLWENGLNRFLEDTSLIGKTLSLADSLTNKAQREQYSIARHISSYLSTTGPIHASVYLVAFTIPYAFCVEQNKIGIDITGEEWSFDTDCVLNTTIHEIYHVGFRLNSPDYRYIKEDPVDEETFIRFCYAYLQSEGMATYVSYKALDLFPSDYRHADFDLLEDDSKVKKAFSRVGMLLDYARTLEIDSLEKEAWDIGVSKRAFYIAGAYMAKVIEEKHGPEFLAGLVSKGSLQFAREYNAIVPDDYRIALAVF